MILEPSKPGILKPVMRTVSWSQHPGKTPSILQRSQSEFMVYLMIKRKRIDPLDLNSVDGRSNPRSQSCDYPDLQAPQWDRVGFFFRTFVSHLRLVKNSRVLGTAVNKIWQ